MTDADPIGDLIVEQLGRATLPLQQVGGIAGTAFLFNELVESTPEFDRVREWLLTADALTQCEVAEIGLRPDMITPAGAASDLLAMLHFKDLWSRGDTGVAAMITTVLHEHGRKKGWSWDTQEVTDGWAATAAHLREIDGESLGAYALGHMASDPRAPGKRPLALAQSTVARGGDGVIRWRGAVPDGFVGAPVIIVRQLDDRSFGLHCAGLLLPGEPDNPIATFDVIRTLVGELVQST